MIVVDSSIWIDHFNSPVSRGAVALFEVFKQKERIAVLPIVLTEVLMGFKEDRHFKLAREALLQVPSLVPTTGSYLKAAELFRRLQKKGITVRGAIDCLIAQTCMEHSGVLLTRDRDFERIAKHVPLKIWLV